MGRFLFFKSIGFVLFFVLTVGNAFSAPQSEGITIESMPGMPCASKTFLQSSYAPITCGAIIKNNTSSMIGNLTSANFSLSVSPIQGQVPGAAVLSASVPCAQIPPNGGACPVTYTFTPATGNGLDYVKNSPQVKVAFTYKEDKVTQAIPVLFQYAISSPSILSCSKKSTTQSVGCTLVLNSVVSHPISSYSISPLVDDLGVGGDFTVMTKPAQITTGNANNVIRLKYTPPAKITAKSVHLKVNYSDSLGDFVASNRVLVSLSEPVSISAIRCNPNPVIAGQSVACNVVLTNVSGSAMTLSEPDITVSGVRATNVQDACLTNLQPLSSCQVTFSGTASNSSTSLLVDVKSSDSLFKEQKKIFAVYTSGMPHIQANPPVCDDMVLKSGEAVNCAIVLRNLGSVSASGVAMLTRNPNVSGAHVVCQGGSESVMKPGGSCVYQFVYTAPATHAESNDQVTLAYADDQGSVPAFLNPVPFMFSTDSSLSAGLVSGVTMPKSAQYGSGGALNIPFLFTNNTSSEIAWASEKVVAIADGKLIQLNGINLSGSCLDSNSLPAISGRTGSACELSISFQPALFNDFKVGQHVKLVAMLIQDDGAAVGIGAQDMVIGDAPIFSNVVTSQLFVNGASEMSGAFVFSNNSDDTLLNLRAVRQFLPMGYQVDTSGACSSLLSAYPAISACAAGDSLSSGSSCYACFVANQAKDLFKGQSLDFKAQLAYEQSSAMANRIVPVTPSYRTFTLKNMCSGPVWPAFVSGAAYYYCNSNSDCPAGTQCYVSGHQCQVPASAGSTPCPKGTYTYPGTSSCSAGCNDSTVGSTVCPQGSSCNKDNGLCYWALPKTASGSAIPNLSHGDKAVVSIPNVPLTDAGNWSVVWSGGLIGRTGCNGDASQCDSAQCQVDKSGSCKLGEAPVPPFTQAEFTLLYKNIDYYDIEIINGFSIPVSMEPAKPLAASFASPYTCGAAGSPAYNPQCQWDFKMNAYAPMSSAAPVVYSPAFQALHAYVTKGGQGCVPGSTKAGQMCANPEVCGISQDNVTIKKNAPVFTCGKLVGFWSTNQVCASNPSLKYVDPADSTHVLNCGETDSSGESLSAWFGCNAGDAAHSCYASGKAPANCCGCPYWMASTTESSVAPSSYFQKLFSPNFVLTPTADNMQCQSTHSSFWVNRAYGPSLIWMKQGCSSTYTFPYDDATSTFTCSTASQSQGKEQDPAGKVNENDYTVTFCPGGNQGTINAQPVYVKPSSSTLLSSADQSQRFATLKWIHHVEQRFRMWV